MDITDHVRATKGGHTSLLRGILKTKHSDGTGLVTHSVHGQVYRLARSPYNICDFRRKQRILSCPNRQVDLGQDGIHSPPRLVPLHKNVIWSQKSPIFVSKRNGRLADGRKMAVCLLFFRYYRNIVLTSEEHIEQFLLRLTLLNAGVTLNLNKCELHSLLEQPRQCYSPWASRGVKTDYCRRARTCTIRKLDKSQIIFWVEYHLPRFCSERRLHCCFTAQNATERATADLLGIIPQVNDNLRDAKSAIYKTLSIGVSMEAR